MLERCGMASSKTVVTPMDGQIEPEDIKGELINTSSHLQAVGGLMYLAVGTRPDISFAVSRLAQFVQHPTRQLWVAVKRVLRYICGSKDVGLKCSSSTNLSPIGYNDSDWGGCKINRKSTSGFVFIMAGAAVSWKSKKQGCVAQSSSEAEYMALSSAVKEAIWLRKIFETAMLQPAPPVHIFAG